MASFQVAYRKTSGFLEGFRPGSNSMTLLGLGADFRPAYDPYILPNEGGFVNDGADRGGMTYAGIARNFNPAWEGWTFIDFKLRTQGEIKRNAKFPEIQYMVDNFYLDRWNKNGFPKIVSQHVANLLFDFHVHSQSWAIKITQRILGIAQDGAMGPQTLAAINSVNANDLHERIKNARIEFLKGLVASDPTQGKFLDGWIARVKRFPSLVTENKQVTLTVLGIAVTAGFSWWLYRQLSDNNENRKAA